MSLSQTIAPISVATPATTGAWLRRAGLRVWQALENAGQRRAERELAEFARLHAHQFPELASYAQPRPRA